MSTPWPDDSSEAPDTLYDPPPGISGDEPTDEDSVSLRVSLPQERADRLRAVAQQIGLSPSMVAKRAIDMVCEEVVTIQEDTRSPSILVDKYQARIDLLHSIEEAKASDDAPIEDRDASLEETNQEETPPDTDEEA